METNLILVFTTSDDSKKTLTIASPKADLSKETVYAAMQKLIDDNFFTNTLSEIADAYYKAVTVTALN